MSERDVRMTQTKKGHVIHTAVPESSMKIPYFST